MIKYTPITDLNQIVPGQTTESQTLEFKSSRYFNNEKNFETEEISLDICQFANHLGGTLLIGVEEETKTSGMYKVAGKITGVEDVERCKRIIISKIINHVYPSDLRYRLEVLGTENKIQVIAIYVEPIKHGIACVSSQKREGALLFPKRSEGQKYYLTPIEVEKMLSDPFRSIRLKIEDLQQITKDISIISPMITTTQGGYQWKDQYEVFTSEWIRLEKIRETEIAILINSRFIHIPYSLVKDVWITEFNKIGMILNATLFVPKTDRIQIIYR